MDAHGKHLFLRFEGDLTLHSHLRMGGAWGVYRRGQRWRRSPRRAWLVIRTPEHEVVQFDGPVLELMTDSRTRFDQRLANLGPDVLAEEFDEARSCAASARTTRRRGIADALLDQRNVAGIGNLWKAEACFLAGVSPWRPLGEVSDELRARDRGGHPAAHAGVRRGRLPAARPLGLRAPRAPVPALRHAHQGPRPGRRQPHHLLVPRAASHDPRRATRAPTTWRRATPSRASRAALEHGVDMIEFDVLRDPDGRLVLAHDYEDAAERECADAGRGPRPPRRRASTPHLQLDVDLKLPGYEREVVDGLARARPGRALARVLHVRGEPRPPRRAAARAAPRLVGAARAARLHALGARRARLRRDPLDARAAARRRRRRASAPAGARRSWPTGCWWARRLVEAVHAAGGEVYVWTVDDAARIRRFERWAWTA